MLHFTDRVSDKINPKKLTYLYLLNNNKNWYVLECQICMPGPYMFMVLIALLLNLKITLHSCRWSLWCLMARAGTTLLVTRLQICPDPWTDWTLLASMERKGHSPAPLSSSTSLGAGPPAPQYTVNWKKERKVWFSRIRVLCILKFELPP